MSVNNMNSMMSVNTINSLLKQAWGVESISTTKTQLFVSDATKTLVAGSYKGLILKLIATINPKQDLHGYDKPWVGGAGKNLFYINPQTLGGITISLNDDGSYTLNGSATNAVFLRSDPYLLKAGTYRLSASSSSSSGYFVRIRNADTLALLTTSTADGGNGVNVSISEDTNVFWEITVLADTTFSNVKVYPQLELGTIKTAFEPYSNICPISGWGEVKTYVSPTTSAEDGTTYTADLPETVYGGTLDVVNGVLNIKPYYASYNGETLSGEWISDRDVYSEGRTPTIGAQVVNVGATGTNVQLTPKQVTTLLGTNNVWADSGDVTVEYWGDTGTIKTDSGEIVTFNII